MENIFVLIFEIIGPIAFAVSGAMVGIEKKMDILGVAVLGMTTAVGGGVIRDVILDITPPSAFTHPIYFIISIVVSILVFLPFVSTKININNWIIMIMDAIGLGIFTVVGVQAGASSQNFFLTFFVGVITGVGGGVMRDIFAGDKPMIFVRHFYASAAIIGSLISTALWNVNNHLAMIVGAVVIIILRIRAAKFKWHLPKAK